MITIRRYRKNDARVVGVLIADTCGEFNLSELGWQQQQAMLGPFVHTRSKDPAHQKAIADSIQAPTVLVAELNGEIVGV